MTGQPNEISTRYIGGFDPQSLVSPDTRPLNPTINGYLRKYFAQTLRDLPGNVRIETATSLVQGIADFEAEHPLYSVTPFKYLPIPNLASEDITWDAEHSTLAAVSNMHFMLERFGRIPFAADSPRKRKERLETWVAHVDDDYDIHLRGGSGAGTFSIDLGLGVRNPHTPQNAYKELWRTGVDTVLIDDKVGTRFIRTGSGIKAGDDFKINAFANFRKKYNMLPQRLLGMLGLYFMRELEPDYAVALTTEGAKKYSTLNRSKGGCDYTGIFNNIGFEKSDDPNYLRIPVFGEGFYDAVKKAKIKRREEAILQTAVDAVNNMRPSNMHNEHTAGRTLFPLCSDDHPGILAREIAMAYDSRGRRRLA